MAEPNIESGLSKSVTLAKPRPEEIAQDLGESFDPLDRSNPRSIVNLVPPKFGEWVSKVPQKYFDMTEAELMLVLMERHKDCVPLLKRLRIGLWAEYNRVQEHSLATMNLSNAYNGICSVGWIYYHLCPWGPKLAYVMRAPQNYLMRLEQVLEATTQRLEEIVNLPVMKTECRCHYKCKCAPSRTTSPFGKNVSCACSPKCVCEPKVDIALATLQLEIHKTAEARVKGAVIQRQKIDLSSTSKNLHIHSGNGPLPLGSVPATGPQEIGDIDKKIAELEKQLATGQSALPPAREVVPIFVETPQPDVVVVDAEAK